MKQVIIFIGVVLLLLNAFIGCSYYELFNLLLTSGTIVWTTLLLYLTQSKCIKDGFKIAFTILFGLLGMVEFVLAVITPKEFGNNPLLIILFAVQIVLLFISKVVSREIK